MQHDDMVKEVTADTPDESFHVRILPRAPGGDHDLLDAHVSHPLPKRRAVDAVPIAQQVARALLPWEGLATTCWAVHAAVGCSVTLICTMRRRSWARMTSTKSTLYVTVGTVKKSRATRSLTWVFRKPFHVGDGGLRCRTRYFSTVDFATSMPSFRSSPTIRGAPYSGLARNMLRIRSRTSLAITGRPGVPCWLKRRQ